jgi:hypothetical protein
VKLTRQWKLKHRKACSIHFGVKSNMTIDKKWTLDRVPTQKEKVLGIVLAIIILIFFSLVLSATIFLYLREESPIQSWIPIFVSLVFFSGALALFVRVSFSKRQKPSKGASRMTAYVIFCFCCAMIVAPFIVGFTSQGFYMIGVGILGIVGSKQLLSYGGANESS